MVKPTLLKSINYFLLVLAIAGPVWFFASIYSYHTISQDLIKTLPKTE